MVIKYTKKKLFNIGKIILCATLLIVGLINVNNVTALSASMVKVNGIFVLDSDNPVYEATNGYNPDHGIMGVSYNTTNNTLDLTSASIESIYANGDLTINVTNNNAVDAVTSNIAVEARGDLKVIGSNGSSLNIAAMSTDDRAIEISAGSTLTVGDSSSPENLISLNIQRGRNVNTVGNTVVVAGNTYNYTEPGPGGPGGPGEPLPGMPLTLSIGGTVVIDETADPQITSDSGPGWSISQGFMGIYQLNIDTGVTLDYISGTGDGALSISGDANISENANGLSIDMAGRVNIFGGMSDSAGDLTLAGGIYTEGTFSTYDRDFTLGSTDFPTTRGVFASEVEVSMGNLTIYTTGTALDYFNPMPAEGEGLIVKSSAGRRLSVEASDIATNNVLDVIVSGGGSIDLNYSTSLGAFTPQSSYWPWTDMTGTEEENPLPITVTCTEGTSTTEKYKMTNGANNFLLESTAGTLYQLGWNIPDAEDSIVTNGTVRIISANGYRFTSGGYTDYSIEAGSQVTVELLPDYGYQYVSGGLNGNETMPEEGKGSYTFTMPDGHLHLSAIFEPKSDIVNVNDDAIKSATISMPADQIKGNAELTINDDTTINEDGFKKAAGSLKVEDYLELDLNEVIYKGTTADSWKTPVTELSEKMTVNLQLVDQLKGYTDYTVLRDHNGTITKLASTYDPATGILSFQTDAYSDYAIAHGETRTNPNTYDGIMRYFVIGFFSVAGLIASITYLAKRKLQYR